MNQRLKPVVNIPHLSPFVNVEYKSTFASNVHEVVESCVVFMHVLSVNAEIISNSNDTGALVQDVVNLLLEYVLTAGQSWGKMLKTVLS